MSTLSPPRPPVFTNQERYVMVQLGAIVSGLDRWRQRCTDLERRLTVCPKGPLRHQLIRDLFAARQAEEAATLDLRDGAAYLAGLVRPLGTGGSI